MSLVGTTLSDGYGVTRTKMKGQVPPHVTTQTVDGYGAVRGQAHAGRSASPPEYQPPHDCLFTPYRREGEGVGRIEHSMPFVDRKFQYYVNTRQA